MSQLKVNAISDSAGANGNAITLATDGTCTAKVTNNLSNRNLVINGDFQVAQRGTSSTSTGYQTVDRWKGDSGTIGSITVTQSQQSTSSSDEPYKKGFAKFFRLALSGAGTANAGGWIEFQQRIEAQNIANSGWDFKNPAKNVTLSFWIRASTNQTFYGYINTADGTAKRYSFSFTASGNNAWTKITKTIPGHSDLQFDSDNGNGFQIVITPFYGTTYTNNQTLDAWHTPVSANYLPDMASTWLTAGASTIDLTGVQLEVGDTATDFEHRSYAEELLRCQRYCWVYSGEAWATFFLGIIASSTTWEGQAMLPVTMRAKPSVTYSGNFRIWDGTAVGTVSATGVSSSSSFDSQMWLTATCSGASFGAGNSSMFSASNDADAKITFDAEL